MTCPEPLRTAMLGQTPPQPLPRRCPHASLGRDPGSPWHTFCLKTRPRGRPCSGFVPLASSARGRWCPGLPRATRGGPCQGRRPGASGRRSRASQPLSFWEEMSTAARISCHHCWELPSCPQLPASSRHVHRELQPQHAPSRPQPPLPRPPAPPPPLAPAPASRTSPTQHHRSAVRSLACNRGGPLPPGRPHPLGQPPPGQLPSSPSGTTPTSQGGPHPREARGRPRLPEGQQPVCLPGPRRDKVPPSSWAGAACSLATPSPPQPSGRGSLSTSWHLLSPEPAPAAEARVSPGRGGLCS